MKRFYILPVLLIICLLFAAGTSPAAASTPGFNITATASTHGTISPSGVVFVPPSGSQAFVMTADTNAYIDDVVIDGVSQGPLDTYTFTNVTANHTIAVSFLVNSYTIVATAGTNGVISPSGSVSVNEGTNQSFTITPNAGYHVQSLTVDGSAATPATSYTFTNVQANHSISASFAIDTFTISASSSANGTISPSGSVSKLYNSSQSFTFSPDANYHLVDVQVDEVSKGPITSYTFSSIKANHSIFAVFGIDSVLINDSTGSHGSITPSGRVYIPKGAEFSATISPDLGYHIASVTLDGSSQGVVSQVNLSNVSASHLIYATFAIDSFSITGTAGSGGQISPAGTSMVAYGGSKTYTITPDSGFHITGVRLDSDTTNIGPLTTYTFEGVTGNHSITATFAANNVTITSSKSGNGTISPLGAVSVAVGSSQSFTITPATGNHLVSLFVDGAPVTKTTNYTFSNVTANHTIAATFGVDTLTITESNNSGGTVTPSGVTVVSSGGSQVYTITSDSAHSVDDVVIDGVSQGPIESYTFTNVTGNHTIAVTFVQDSYTITASASGNGVISPSGAVAVNAGTNKTFNFTPNTGNHIVALTVDGAAQTVASSYTFNNVLANHTINVTFGLDSFTITASASGPGSISPSGASIVTYNGSKSYTITPDAGNHIVNVLVNGSSQGAISSYTFTGVKSNQTISASFAVDSFTITASAGSNGSISPSGSIRLQRGGSQGFEILPNTGYHVASVVVDGSNKGALSSYFFDTVGANHTISASFAIDTFTITATAGTGGTVTPAGVTNVTYGGSQAYTITADTGYTITNVLVDGETSLGAVTSYTFSSVNTNHTISATFTPATVTITSSKTGNGTISPLGATTVTKGANQTFTITPTTGNHLVSLVVDGSPVTKTTSYTFTNVQAAHTIAATFGVDTLTITESNNSGGTVTPSGGTNVLYGGSQTYTITSDTTHSVDDVVIDGVSQGPIETYTFSNVTANHTIAVTFVLDSYTITASASGNGVISPSGAVAVNAGTNKTFNFTPNTGNHIVALTVDGTPQTVASSYTFNNVLTNHTISVSLGVDSFTITASSSGPGSVTPAGVSTVLYNGSKSYTITPDAGNHIVSVLVNGISQGAISSYTFTSVKSNQTISASFAADTFTITASAGANGSISPSGVLHVVKGGSQGFEILPNNGYHVASVVVDGSNKGALSSYFFDTVGANHTISASFAIDTFTITTTAGTGGTVTPAGVTNVTYGGSQAYTITADTGYTISNVFVDGETSLGAVSSYTFSSVNTNHTISATFAPATVTITSSKTGNGTISPVGATTVTKGANQSFTITPATGNHLVSLVVDGSPVTKTTSYTFTNVQTAHTIAATFGVDTLTITESNNSGGTVTPSGSSNVLYGGSQTYTITSDTTHSVDDVVIDGVSQGPIETYTFTNVTANHTIAVSFVLDSYTITASATGNGVISPSGAVAVNAGTNKTFNFTPNTGNHIVRLTVDGVTQTTASSYTFTNVLANHSVNVTFGLDSFSITASASGPGSISPSGASIVTYNGSKSYTITPDAGNHIVSVLVNGVSQGAISSYTFTSVKSNQTISASFAADTFTITASAGANGSISPSGVLHVVKGGSQGFEILPNNGYHVASVVVDGSNKGALSSYFFDTVGANHTISASFAIDTFTITATAGTGGTVTPAGVTNVTSGGSQAYTITADTGYTITNVLVDGETSLGAVTSYTFSSVNTNHTISATFTPATVTITSSKTGNGTISPVGATTVTKGANQSFTITPATGNHLVSLVVDGSPVTKTASYTFTNVQTAHTIAATFGVDTLTITESNNSGGTVTPSGSTNVLYGGSQTYTITSDTTHSVDDVVIDGVSQGPIETYTFTNVTANHTIAVTFVLDSYTITASASGNGVISPSGSVAVNAGTNKTFNFTPNTGNHIVRLTIDGVAQTTASSYTFTNVLANHTISVSFGVDSFTITASSSGAGSVTPAGVSTVLYNGSKSYTITPDAGNHIVSVLVNGISQGAISSYTFTSVKSNQTISASFAADTFTITASAGANGSISPSGVLHVVKGGSQGFEILPNTGYHVASVVVDGSNKGALSSYFFDTVSANHTISASFAIDTFTITATAGTGGTVTPAGVTNVTSGGSQAYTITADTGYTITNVLVDGETSLGAVTSYTFSSVNTNHTISATFTPATVTITSSKTGNGTISPFGATTVTKGANQTFTITPTTGNHLVSLVVDGSPVTKTTSYTFTNVQTAHTIAATFGVDTLTITESNNSGGTVTPSGSTNVLYGGSQTYTITSDTTHSVDDVVIDGVSQGPIETYTFTNVTANHTIAVTFVLDSYTITASASGNGVISPSGSVAVNAGTNKTFNFTPNTGNHIVRLTVDGVTQTTASSYTFTNVLANHSINVTFGVDSFTVTATTSGTGSGTITPSGVSYITYNGSRSYTIAAASGSALVDVTVNGVSQGAITSYTFSSVKANQTINAQFRTATFTITSSKTGNGTISPLGSTTVAQGGTQSYSITPASGNHLVSLLVDGSPVTRTTSYSFTNVQANHTIAATFGVDTLTITESNNSGGTVTPSGSTNVLYGGSQTYTITSDTTHSVDDVVIDGVSQGPIETYTFTNVTANHTIAVTFVLDSYTITASATGNGVISPSGSVAVNAGTNKTFNFTPNTGNHIVRLTVDGVTQTTASSYTFTNVLANHTINVTFGVDSFTVTANTIGTGTGTITPSGVTYITYNGSGTYSIAPATGSHLLNVLVNGVSKGAIGSFTFTGVKSNQTITASFGIDSFTITASAGTHGTIAPSGSTVVTYGGNQTYNITPDIGYHLDSLIVDGEPTSTQSNSYSFSNITANHTIRATFSVDQLTITASAGAHGSISPTGETGVSYGGSQLYTITPDQGYHVANVFVGETSVGAVTSYQFTNVTSNQFISASFAIDTFTVAVTSTGNGTVTPSGTVTLTYGESQTFTIAANSHNRIDSLIVDGVLHTAASSYAFDSISANHSLRVVFAPIMDTIVATASAHGLISPSGTVTLQEGGSQTFTIAADSGAQIIDVQVDGSSVGKVTSYTFSDLSTNHTIHADFAIFAFTITASAGSHGSISPTGSVSVTQGSNQSFTFTPDNHYSVTSVIVDGEPVTVASSYTFTNIQANHTISVSFALDSVRIVASAGLHGHIIPGDTVMVGYGTDKTFSIVPDQGYRTVEVFVDGFPRGPITSFTFTSVIIPHTIQATFTVQTFTITATTVDSGTITPSGTVTYEYGQSQTYQIAPAEGYHIVDVRVDNISKGPIQVYSFDSITASHVITAFFSNTYTVTATSDTNGTVTPSGAVSVIQGTSQEFTIVPKTGRHILDVLVDSVSVGRVESYTFENVLANHTIQAKFGIDTFAVTVESPTHGPITPSGRVITVYGSNKSFTITPETGYHVVSVFVDTVALPNAVSSYTFSNITANHTLGATFAINVYTISAQAGSHGTISPSGTVNVTHGSGQTFTITADTGYHLDSLLVDNAPVTLTSSYVFSAVSRNHSIRAAFALNQYVLNTDTIDGSGTVSRTPDLALYDHGTSVIVTAVPHFGWTFSGWTGDTTAAESVLAITMTHPYVLKATFVPRGEYLARYRTASYLQWATATDQAGKAKPAKRRNVLIDFQFPVNPSLQDDGSKLTLGFSANASGYIYLRGTTTVVDSFKNTKLAVITFATPMTPDKQLEVIGVFSKGKGLKSTFAWGAGKKNTVSVYDLYKPGLPMPNLHNVGEELFPGGPGQVSPQFPGGLLVGVPQPTLGAKSVLMKKYADVKKSMTNMGSFHNSGTGCLPVTKQAKYFAPNKIQNHLFAELMTLKMNIAASAAGKFPVGFGELTYSDASAPYNPFNGLPILTISDIADSLLSCMNVTSIQTPATINATLDSTLDKLNGAFSASSVDTISFASKTEMTGAKPLIEVPYLRLTTGIIPRPSPAAIAPYAAVPDEYILYQNYPNPFNPTTTIEFNLPFASIVTLKVYNMLGQEVATLIDHEQMDDGTEYLDFDATNLPSGVYFYRLTARGTDDDGQELEYNHTMKMVLMK